MTDALTGFDILSPVNAGLRMALAVAAGLLIGLERQRHYQPAGLRTHMALALGSCLMTLASIYIPLEFRSLFPGADPGRLSAQVISGIGFLGAGAIFRYGFNVRGLTTAASLWTTAGIGLTFGAGFYLLGGIATVMLILILQGFEIIEDRLVEPKNLRILTIVFRSEQMEAKRVIGTVKSFNVDIRQTSITEFMEDQTVEIRMSCRLDEDFSIRTLFESIKDLGGIKTLRIE